MWRVHKLYFTLAHKRFGKEMLSGERNMVLLWHCSNGQLPLAPLFLRVLFPWQHHFYWPRHGNHRLLSHTVSNSCKSWGEWRRAKSWVRRSAQFWHRWLIERFMPRYWFLRLTFFQPFQLSSFTGARFLWNTCIHKSGAMWDSRKCSQRHCLSENPWSMLANDSYWNQCNVIL